MIFNDWNISNREYNKEKQASRDALFTTGNGNFGIRGFFEEDSEGIEGLGGIYMAGIFGKGCKEAADGESRELCNLPHLLRLELKADGKKILPEETDFFQELDLDTGVYTHSYTHTTGGRAKLKLRFERFPSLAREEQIWQKVTITAQQPAEIVLCASIDSAVTNLNWESTEPLPIQPGRNHILWRQIRQNGMMVCLDGPDNVRLSIAQTVRINLNGCEQPVQPVCTDTEAGCFCRLLLACGDVVVLEKAVRVCRSSENIDLLPVQPDYARALQEHSDLWRRRWQQCDIQLTGPVRDQCALRYAMFQLMAACPQHTDRVSIGARGLSGEMYEGCVFWDNEIFQLPFFTWSDPRSARRLLSFRRNTLEAAKQRAKKLWFKGAQYPWQVNLNGEEQTPTNGGGFYAIHITADVMFALQQYVQVTKDRSILLEGGAEMLLETARFWLSRSDKDPDGSAHIRCVRGPNEYDVFVDDNAYTNMLVKCNLRAAVETAGWMEHSCPQKWTQLCRKISFDAKELAQMAQLAEQLVIPAEGSLILEDAGYAKRRPLDLKKAKPTGKRIIDSTLPYEALPLYQITKQADVVLLMALLPHAFTAEQKECAFAYYEPRTAHDSSLSYAPHGWLLAQLGQCERAYSYFEKSAFLDVEDRQLNTVSGIHFANFGGTWQTAFSGFFGITQKDKTLMIDPHLPAAWTGFSVKLCYQGKQLCVSLQQNRLRCECQDLERGESLSVCLAGSGAVLNETQSWSEVQI